ncbi:MAG: helix-turn-helix transcriptional regulator [Lachnospiraceae bacterium]|nr:helix-turn-helix transcriptional regulator [Lachnospiraceae bacterium]
MNEIKKTCHLANQIKYYRKKLNMTQEALSEKMGYTKQTISYWEQGKHVPGQEDIIKLAEIFSISSIELLSISPEKKNVRNGLESL